MIDNEVLMDQKKRNEIEKAIAQSKQGQRETEKRYDKMLIKREKEEKDKLNGKVLIEGSFFDDNYQKENDYLMDIFQEKGEFDDDIMEIETVYSKIEKIEKKEEKIEKKEEKKDEKIEEKKEEKKDEKKKEEETNLMHDMFQEGGEEDYYKDLLEIEKVYSKMDVNEVKKD